MTPQPSRPQGLDGWALAVDRMPVFLAVLLLFLSPFLLREDGVHPFLAKTLLARVVVFGLLAAFALQCARTRRVVWLQAPFWFPLAALGLWCVFTALVSPYPRLSASCLLNGSLPFLWLALLFVLFRELWRLENLLISFLAGALGASVWVLGQRVLGWSGPWAGGTFREFAGRWIGCSGDPRFLTGLFLVAWPLALSLLMRARHRFSRIWWGITLASILAALLWTESRSGWAGLIVGAAVFAAVNFKEAPGHPNRWRWAPLGFFALLVAVTPFTPVGGRLGALASPGDPGRVFRADVWEAAFHMAKEHPLSGVGYGAFPAAFPSYRPQSVSLRQAPGATDIEHPRNIVLEWTAETGFLGLLLALWLWAALLGPWWKLTWGNAVPRPLGAAAFAVFTGVLTAGMLDDVFTQVTTVFPLFFVAAMPAALTQRFHEVEGSPVRLRVSGPGVGSWVLVPVAAVALAFFVFQFFTAFREQASDLYLAKAVRASEAADWDKAFEAFRGARESNDASWEASYFEAAARIRRGSNEDARLALEALRTVGGVSPDFALTHLLRSEALERLGRRDEAFREWNLAVRLDGALILRDPRFLQQREWTAKGDPRKALALLSDLEKDYPDHFWVHLDRSALLLRMGDAETARREVDLALAVWPLNPEALMRLAEVAGAQGDSAGLAYALKRLGETAPRDGRVSNQAASLAASTPGRN